MLLILFLLFWRWKFGTSHICRMNKYYIWDMLRKAVLFVKCLWLKEILSFLYHLCPYPHTLTTLNSLHAIPAPEPGLLAGCSSADLRAFWLIPDKWESCCTPGIISITLFRWCNTGRWITVTRKESTTTSMEEARHTKNVAAWDRMKMGFMCPQPSACSAREGKSSLGWA